MSIAPSPPRSPTPIVAVSGTCSTPDSTADLLVLLLRPLSLCLRGSSEREERLVPAAKLRGADEGSTIPRAFMCLANYYLLSCCTHQFDSVELLHLQQQQYTAVVEETWKIGFLVFFTNIYLALSPQGLQENKQLRFLILASPCSIVVVDDLTSASSALTHVPSPPLLCSTLHSYSTHVCTAVCSTNE